MSSCNKKKTVIEPSLVTYQSYGLTGHSVYKLSLFGNFLYACTSDGIYRKSITNFSAQWENIGFKGQELRAMWVFNGNTIVVSTYDAQLPANSSVYRTQNGGNTWIDFQGNFGGGLKEPMFNIIADPSNNNILYATGANVVAKSINGGVIWTPVWGAWGGTEPAKIEYVAVNPSNPAEVWAGGQNDLNEALTMKSTSSGDLGSWTDYVDVVVNPTSNNSLAFDNTKNYIYTGWDGALLRTDDHGITWSNLINSTENRSFNSIIIDPSLSGTIYTAGSLDKPLEPQPIVLFRSKDDGLTWESFEKSQTGLFGGVLSMEITEDSLNKNIYLGLYKGGVYVATISK